MPALDSHGLVISGQVTGAFSKRGSLMNFFQDIAEHFYPERAEFTVEHTLARTSPPASMLPSRRCSAANSATTSTRPSAPGIGRGSRSSPATRGSTRSSPSSSISTPGPK